MKRPVIDAGGETALVALVLSAVWLIGWIAAALAAGWEAAGR